MINYISQWIAGASVEAIIGSSALLLTLATIFQTRRHNRLSVTPHLNTFLDRRTDGQLNLLLINNGIGPAKITSIKLLVDGKAHIGDLNDIAFSHLQRFLPEGINITHAKHLDSNYAILNGDMLVFLSARIVDPSLSKKEIEDSLKKIHVVIKYKSFYGKRFKLDTRKTFWSFKNK